MSHPLIIQRVKGPFYCEYEGYSPAQRKKAQVEKMRYLVEKVLPNSPFYRERLPLGRIHCDSDYPFADCPIVSANDLRPHISPQGRDLLTTDDPGHIVFQSGGTTGVPKTSLFTYAEMEMINECNARGFYASGLKKSDRVANLWAVGSLYMTFIHMHRIFSEYGCMTFPFSNHTPADFVGTVAKMFQVNCFSGITSVVLNTLRKVDEVQPGSIKIEKVYFGGEHIYEADRIELRDRFGAQQVLAPGYGTVDSWYLGYQCGHCTNGIFHAFDDMVHLEVLHEETQKHCKPDEVGILHATVLERFLMPIVRFKVGDKARMLSRRCDCGRTTPLFELLGRGDDMLRIGYDSLDYKTMQELIVKFKKSNGSLQMEKKRKDGKDLLILRLETQNPQSDHDDMTRDFIELLLKERPSLREFISKGTVWPVTVEWWKPGTLPQNPKTGKLIRVIDSIS
jgi:phenylacetate-CoA ligase